MKTLIVTLGGACTVGDLLIIEYSHPRGGVSAIKAQVREPKDEIVENPVSGMKSVKTTGDTLATLVQQFLDDISRGQSWPGEEFKGAAREGKPNSFAVKCSDYVSDVIFKAYVQGAETETIEIEVL